MNTVHQILAKFREVLLQRVHRKHTKVVLLQRVHRKHTKVDVATRNSLLQAGALLIQPYHGKCGANCKLPSVSLERSNCCVFLHFLKFLSTFRRILQRSFMLLDITACRGWRFLLSIFFCVHWKSSTRMNFLEKYFCVWNFTPAISPYSENILRQVGTHAVSLYWLRINRNSIKLGYFYSFFRLTLLTLYGPNSIFRLFSGHSLWQALFVYRLILATLIGSFLMILLKI